MRNPKTCHPKGHEERDEESLSEGRKEVIEESEVQQAFVTQDKVKPIFHYTIKIRPQKYNILLVQGTPLTHEFISLSFLLIKNIHYICSSGFFSNISGIGPLFGN